jgi:ABC-2 type transport system ATP-binding protein
VIDPSIEVTGLTKRYGARAVVDDVSLAVPRGEVVAVIGPNGAGKTTTAEIIEGYRSADAGSVRVLGVDPFRAGRAHRARVGLMLQEGGVDLRARPAESLHQYAAFHADPLDVEALLDELGLRDVAVTPFRWLSGGERQRLGFALALVGRPDVLILDEPTTGMDPQARAVVRARIASERESGTAVLVTSHELADVERLADRIVVLVAGRIAGAGTPSELTAGLRPRLRFRLDAALDEPSVRSLSGALRAAVRATESAAHYEVDGTEPSPRLIAALAAWCDGAGRLIVESRAVGGSLEDAYFDLVAGAGGVP